MSIIDVYTNKTDQYFYAKLNIMYKEDKTALQINDFSINY